MDNKIEQLKEYVKIAKDTPYALKTYLKTYDNTKKTFVPLELFPDQIQLLHDYEKYNENITRKYRQAGVTTVTAAWISKNLQLAKPENPERVLIIANKKDTAVEMANKIRAFLEQWPDWLNVGFSPDKNSESRFKLNNGCEVKAVATSADALRGYTPTILIFDEAAYIEAGEDFWAASMASLSTGGKIILISCVIKDTFVFTSNGLQQVNDFIKEKKPGNGYFIEQYSIRGKDKLRTSKIMFNNGKQKTLKIRTANSFLEGTETHKVWAFSFKNKNFDWYRLDELMLGDYINVNYNFDLWGNNDSIKTIYGDSISDDLLYLIGLIINHNYSTKTKYRDNQIRFKSVKSVDHILDNIGATYKRDGKFNYRILSDDFNNFIADLGVLKGILPKELLQMSKLKIVHLLRGIFEVGNDSIKISFKSKNLIEQLRMLLLNFGVLTTYNELVRPFKLYSLICDKYNSKIFLDKIGLNVNKKILISDVDKTDLIPNSVEYVISKLNEYNITEEELPKDLKTKFNLGYKSITRLLFNKFLNFFDSRSIPYDKEFLLDKVLINDSKWDKINEIEKSENETYDFSLYNNKNDFWAHSIIYNGILGHQTPNGFDPIYYGVYDQSLRGINDFHITDLRWFKDPRYNKDLRWIKCKDITHYMLNRDQYDDKEVVLHDFILENYKEYEEQGYKPFSSWFESMSKKFKYDRRKISQELECVSASTMITIKDIETNEIKNIKIGDLYNDLSNLLNNKYQILTPNGFENFDGIQKLKKKTIEVFFENGLTLRGSFNHQIYDYEGNPIKLSEIKIGDKIKSHDGFLAIINIKKYYNKTNVFDIINSGDSHLYYTNNILSHNCDFLGSGDGVISSGIQDDIAKNMIRTPIEKYMQGTFWQWKEPIIGHRYILGCLTPYEKVLTNDGLKSIIDVTTEDKLINENGDIVNIKNKQIYEVIDEPIFEITVDNTYRTTKFTKEHPILISKPILKRNYNFNERYWDFDFKYIKTENVKVGDWIKVPNIYKKQINVDFNEKWENDIDQVRKDYKIETPLEHNDFWWLIGLWLGDGWVQNNNNSYSIHFCFNKCEKYYLDKSIEIIKILLHRKPSIIEKDSTFEITFNSKELYGFILNNFGQYSIGKKIPEWFKYQSNEHKLNLIKGYFDSNGCWLKTIKKNQINSKITFVSVNLELLEGIQDMLFSLGIISSLNKLRDDGKQVIVGKLCDIKKCYNLNLAHYDSLQLIKLINDDVDLKLNKFNINEFEIKNNRIKSSCHLSKDNNWIYFKVKKIKQSNYTGNVYNFECDTNTFMCHHITTHNCDVSRGDSEDFSAINIIDFDDREQVAEYVGKIPPDNLAEIAYRWGLLYGNAYIVTDITGGMGVATSRKLQEMNYKNVYIEGTNTNNIWEYNSKALDKIPGINFNNKRTQIIASFEENLRKGFIVRSERLLNELNTFVFINGRPDHMKGAHDDAIMSMSIALYAADICFNQLEKNESINKSMIDSWTVSERTYNPNKTFYSYGSVFDQVNLIGTNTNNTQNHNYISKDSYDKYSWLFKKK
jgi:hypothetical protein